MNDDDDDDDDGWVRWQLAEGITMCAISTTQLHSRVLPVARVCIT